MSVLKEYEDRVDKTFVLEEFIHSAKWKKQILMDLVTPTVFPVLSFELQSPYCFTGCQLDNGVSEWAVGCTFFF